MIFFKFFLILSLKNLVNAFFYNESTYIESLNFNVSSINYYYPFFNETLLFLNKISEHENLDSVCQNNLKTFIRALKNKNIDALKIYESTGKFFNGKLLGYNYNLGSFDHCSSKEKSLELNFTTKYCVVSIETLEAKLYKKSSSYKKNTDHLSNESKELIDFILGNAHGICLPFDCDINQFSNVVNDVISNFNLSVIPPKQCYPYSGTKATYSYIQILIMFLYATLCIFCVLNLKFESKILDHFSLDKNFKKIFFVDQKNLVERKTDYLNGLKSVLVFISLFAHTLAGYGFAFPYIMSSIKEINFPNFVKIAFEKLLTLGDTLFFCGGFFAMISWYSYIKNSSKQFNFFKFFLARYIMIFIISLMSASFFIIMPHLGTGPFYFDLTNHFSNNCIKNSWKMFALMSNEDRLIDMCYFPSWYLSADFQLYILNYFVFYYLVVNFKIGILIAFVQTVLSLIFHISYSPEPYSFDSFNIYDFSKIEFWYFRSLYHYNSYLAGIIIGFCVKKNLKPKIFENELFRNFIWLFCYLCILLTFLIPLKVKSLNIPSNSIYFKLWPIFEKISFNILLSWCFYSVSMGYAKNLKNIFSHKIFVPISRLSFSLIMCQFIYLLYYSGSLRENLNFSNFAILKEATCIFVFTFIISVILQLVFVLPLKNIINEKLGFKSRRELSANQNYK